ncbi:MAG: histidine--tRNA ligase [Solobacterium sp.]|nr:histidine--tRNA ligase [Solobacterium sp.]
MNYQTARGTHDILPSEMAEWNEVESIMKHIAKAYHYQEIRTPYFEHLAVFKRENDSSDMVNKEMYAFSTETETLALRPEGTAGVIRAFDEHKLYGSMELPAKLFYLGAMFRHERPQKGRQRQFHQFGIENIGIKEPEVDAEVIALGYDIVKKLDIQNIKVLINTLGDDESRNAYRTALREYFTPHLDDLCGDCHRRLEQNPLRVLDCKVDKDKDYMKNAPKLADYLNEESKAYFERVLSALDALGIPYEIDDHLVRGLDYYSHTVFEVVSTRDDSAAQATIFGGGRYDHFVEYFGGPELSGIGFAIGLERLISLAKDEGYAFNNEDEVDAYVIGLGSVQKEVLKVMHELRKADLIVDGNLQMRSLKSQFKSADRAKAKAIIILGEDEVKANTVNIKWPTSKEQVTVSMEDIVKTIKEKNA